MRLQSAIFDMDGTLLDSMPVWNHLGSDLLRRHGIEPAADLDQRLKVLSARQGAALCREEYHLTETVDEIMDEIEAQVDHFYHHEVRPKPGVEKFLSLLKMEGVWMYVATATDRHLAQAALRCAGIDGYFRGIVTTADVSKGKDESPEIYERAMTRLQSNKRDTIIFEDALHAIRTAKSAGFRVAAVYDASAEADQEEIRDLADYYIRSFEEMFNTTTLE